MQFKKILYAEKFDGMPKASNFRIVEEDLGDQLNENGKIFYDPNYCSNSI